MVQRSHLSSRFSFASLSASTTSVRALRSSSQLSVSKIGGVQNFAREDCSLMNQAVSAVPNRHS